MNVPSSSTSLLVSHFPTRAALGAAAAADVSAAIQSLLAKKDHIYIVFAAAPSQNEFLQTLVEDTSIDFSRITAYHMDEYIGLPPDAPQGFGNFLKERIFARASFAAVHYLGGNAPDPQAECARYAALLSENPPDIICMGIGENGHIAFNDPHVALLHDPALCKVVELDDMCRMQQVNDGCFASFDEVPTRALTLTVPTLLRAAHHFCMVPGEKKAPAVRDAMLGPVTMACPASALRLCKDARLYLDAESGALLRKEATL